MSDIKYKIQTDVQSGNVTDLLLPVPDSMFTEHYLQIVCTGSPSAGTVTVKRKATGADRYFALADRNGVPVSLDLTTGDIIKFTGPIDGLKITMASFATATAWYAILRGC